MSRWKSLKENRRSPSECVFIRGGRRAQFKFTLRTCFCLASHLQIEKLRRVPSGEAQSFHVFVERREKTIHALSCLDTFLLLLVEQGKEAHQIRLVSSPAADKATIDRKMSKSKQLLGKIELGQIGTILFFFFFPAFGTMSLFFETFWKDLAHTAEFLRFFTFDRPHLQSCKISYFALGAATESLRVLLLFRCLFFF